MALLFILGLGAVFAGVILALTAMGVSGQRNTVDRSLAAVQAISSVPTELQRDVDRPFTERLGEGVVGWLRSVGRHITPQDKMAALRRKLDLAGNPSGWTMDRVVALKALGLMLGGGLGVMLPLLAGSFAWATVLGVGLAVLGYFLPNIVLYQIAYSRSHEIQRGLPDALDLLTVSVEAGMGFDAALANVARNTDGPLAEEFFRVLQEMQLGSGRLEAMRALSDRTDVRDLQSFVNSMIQADAFGIPIANVLRVQAKEMRVKRSQRAEEAAQKVPIKILFPLIFFILPALLVVVAGPAGISVMQNLL